MTEYRKNWKAVKIVIQIYRVNDEISKYPVNYFDVSDVDQTVIIPDLTFRKYIQAHYSMYYMTKTLDACFYAYMTTTLDDFRQMYKAWIIDYEPLENYNKNETITELRNKGNEKITNGGDITVSGSTENDSENSPTTKHYTTTYDSAAENRLENYDVSTGKTSTETTTEQDTTSETEYLNTTVGDNTAHEINITTNKTYGNIGVTTSQQMLQSEIDLRKQHLIQMYLDTFCKQYMFYVGGDCFVYSDFLP